MAPRVLAPQPLATDVGNPLQAPGDPGASNPGPTGSALTLRNGTGVRRTRPGVRSGMTAICPECTQGKHQNCDGQAWDNDHDMLTLCECQYGRCADPQGSDL